MAEARPEGHLHDGRKLMCRRKYHAGHPTDTTFMRRFRNEAPAVHAPDNAIGHVDISCAGEPDVSSISRQRQGTEIVDRDLTAGSARKESKVFEIAIASVQQITYTARAVWSQKRRTAIKAAETLHPFLCRGRAPCAGRPEVGGRAATTQRTCNQSGLRSLCRAALCGCAVVPGPCAASQGQGTGGKRSQADVPFCVSVVWRNGVP